MVLECGFHGAVHGLFELLVAEARNSQHLWTISGLDGTSFQLPATDGSVAKFWRTHPRFCSKKGADERSRTSFDKFVQWRQRLGSKGPLQRELVLDA
ncbi:unnamed protein product [Durusdinium trenchii]|uniref:Uncharacterized protein n=1 Tax=Durusdinium trenchii TaxID=1381693 RepID=A0ABP0T0Q5_9DINO